MVRLSFPAIVVASRTDPYLAWDRAVAFAEGWGARLQDAGDAGHINTDAGFGPWPDGERLLAELMTEGERERPDLRANMVRRPHDS